MKKHLKPWIGIVFLSWLASILIVPSPDPFSNMVVQAIILVVAGAAYWLGMSAARNPQV